MAPREANRNTVFIDTSLDTHLATIVSDSDTVSDLKQKILLEHRQCFPDIGDIKIHCLKVKRRGNFYHLSESMLVKSAFGTAKKIWFISVDISRVEQNHGIPHMNKHESENQLALPWVTDCRSIDKQNSQTDKSNQFLVHGSTSMNCELVPFVNQEVPNIDQLTSGDSCKDVSKNIEENRSFNDDLEKPFTVNNEKISEKRTRDVYNENLSENVSVKKKRKAQKIEINIKASDKNIGLTYDENSVENRSKSKDLSVEDVGIQTNAQKNTELSEIIPEIATVLENNIHQEIPFEISQKEKDDEIHKVSSSSMKTCASEHLTKNKEVGDALLQQQLGSNNQESAVDQIDKNKEIMGTDNTVEGKKKKDKKSAVKKKDKPFVKHVTDNISSAVSVPVFDEKIINKKQNEVLEKTVTNNVILKEMEISEPTDNNRNQLLVENMEEKSKNDFVIISKKKKKIRKSANEKSKNLTASEVARVIIEEKNDDFNNEIGNKSREVDLKNFSVTGQQPNKTDSVENKKDAKLSVTEKKPKKKIKESIPVQSQKSLSKNEDQKLLLSSKIITPRVSDTSSSRSESFGRPLQSQKVNKRQSTLGQTQVNPVNTSVPVVKSLLDTAGGIFGDDSDSSSADDNAIKNSSSSTRTPSRNSSSSEESQSPSIDSRRNGSRVLKRKEGGGKNSINSHVDRSRMKNVSMADLVRSSSRFKKAKLTASQVEDTESQPVDFVPDTQPMGEP